MEISIRVLLAFGCLALGAVLAAVLGRIAGNVLASEGSVSARTWMPPWAAFVSLLGTMMGLTSAGLFTSQIVDYGQLFFTGLYGGLVLSGHVLTVLVFINFWTPAVVMPVRWLFRQVFHLADRIMSIPQEHNPCNPDDT
ncbi:MAG: hypothetical protein HY711_02835 [Candidatus Melainabacteria bacterium]|nr:hypothetical protein [Candidatus Melainabacteria bacterium]